MSSNQQIESAKLALNAMRIGRKQFLATIMSMAGCTEKEAEKVLITFLAMRAVSIDIDTGEYSITNNKFRSADAMRGIIGK